MINRDRTAAIFIESAARAGAIAAVLVISGNIFKLMFPDLEPNQISISVGILTFIYSTYEQRKKEELTQAEERKNETQLELQLINSKISALQLRLDEHSALYSHPAIHEDIQELKERVYHNSAAINSLHYSLEIDSRLDKLEKGKHD